MYMDNSNGYLTIRQVAERLQVSTRTIHRWLASGAIHAVRVNNTIRISEQEFNRVFGESRGGDNGGI